MTKNPTSPQTTDAKRKEDQNYARQLLFQSMSRNCPKTMQKHWDTLVDITNLRIQARLSGWMPLKGD